jgi:CheY-like chemotaxis protein
MKNGLPFSILLVDDDSDDREIIDEAFKEIGYDTEVKKFINGKALLHYLESVEPTLYPCLIVLDNTLPELDANDLLVLLKENPAYKDIPVVIYTTMLTPFKKEQLTSKGAYACLQKGSTMTEVIRLAEELRHLAESKAETNK